jgi:hypothetical protein
MVFPLQSFEKKGILYPLIPRSLPMKKETYLLRIFLLSGIFVYSIACRKTDISPNQNYQTALTKAQSIQNIPYPQAPVTGCPYAPDYGDSIIYPQPTTAGNDYIVSPVNNPGPGTYFSWPGGMVIDSLNGAINLTQSQTGQRYEIGFVKSGTTDTCITPLILGGASYIDSVYVLADNTYQVYTYYDANPASVWKCPSNGGSGSGNCRFDITGSANNAHVIVDPNNGWIDLKKSLSAGAFGAVPFDGQQISVPIYYQLNDGSNMAIQNITVNIIYYTSRSLIPPALINNATNKLNNFLTSQLIAKSGNTRPPIIIITRVN